MKMPLGPANSTKLLTNSKTILYFINLLFVRKQSNGNDNVIITIFSTHYLKFNSITDSFGQLFYSNAKKSQRLTMESCNKFNFIIKNAANE